MNGKQATRLRREASNHGLPPTVHYAPLKPSNVFEVVPKKADGTPMWVPKVAKFLGQSTLTANCGRYRYQQHKRMFKLLTHLQKGRIEWTSTN